LRWWEGKEVFGDVYELYLKLLTRAGVATVNAAGNDALGDPELTLEENERKRYLHFWSPTSAGGRDEPLIVVGNARMDNTRSPESTYLGDEGGILSLYAVGSHAICGTYDGGWYGPTDRGTSGAAAIVTGMAAYYMADPKRQDELRTGSMATFGMRVKEMLRQTARDNKGLAGINGVPLASLGELVPCPIADQNGRPPVPGDVGDWNGQAVLEWEHVTENTDVIYMPPRVSLNFFFSLFISEPEVNSLLTVRLNSPNAGICSESVAVLCLSPTPLHLHFSQIWPRFINGWC
jgi:hypothetical protein